jgi:uncharacterized membrane protein YfcA
MKCNALRLPIKVSSATSNFMIGVTASASAGAYFMRGDIVPDGGPERQVSYFD